MWAGPKGLAVAAWLTVVLTLIAVILAVATLEKDEAPQPVQITIVVPSGR